MRLADEGDEVALAARLDLQDGKAILGIVEGDALDRARQRLFRRTCRRVRACSNDGHRKRWARERNAWLIRERRPAHMWVLGGARSAAQRGDAPRVASVC